MFGQFFAPLWVRIAAALFGLLLVALAVQSWRLGAANERVEEARNVIAAERAQHAVTRQSLETLTYEMARLVQEGEARSERVDEAMMRVAEETAPLRRRAEQIERDGLGEDYVNDLREAGI